MEGRARRNHGSRPAPTGPKPKIKSMIVVRPAIALSSLDAVDWNEAGGLHLRRGVSTLRKIRSILSRLSGALESPGKLKPPWG